MTGEKRFTFPKIIMGIVLILAALTMIVPLLNILAKALSDPDKVYMVGGLDILPQGFSLVHFKVIMSNRLVWVSIKNSLFITVVGTTLSILLTSSAAYVLTRPGLVGKKVFMYFLIVMMIVTPGMVQEYFLMKNLSLLDNLFSMVMYKCVSVYYLIILMRFFENIPEELLESAKLDGAGHITILFKIFIPLAKVPMLTISMFYAVSKWNEFFYSGIFLNSEKNIVLQVLLKKFVVENDSTNMIGVANIAANNFIAQLDLDAMKAATIIVTIIPILLLYPIVLKYHTSGVLTGGVKE